MIVWIITIIGLSLIDHFTNQPMAMQSMEHMRYKISEKIRKNIFFDRISLTLTMSLRTGTFVMPYGNLESINSCQSYVRPNSPNL